MKAPYKHRLLLLLDEFPALGKLGIFEQAIAYFGGWNIKAYLICQDKAQLDAAYGKDESITSNCHVTVAYAPNKVETAKYLSDRLGVTTIIKEQESISFQGGTGLFAEKECNEVSAGSSTSGINARRDNEIARPDKGCIPEYNRTRRHVSVCGRISASVREANSVFS